MSKKQSRKANLNPKIREIAENLEWTVREYDDGTVEFEKYSPTGEDFIFTVNAENVESEIYDCYDNFDVDDHIEMWVKAKEEKAHTSGLEFFSNEELLAELNRRMTVHA